MASLIARALVLVVAPVLSEVFFEERFDDEGWEQRWVHSKAKGGNGPAGRFEWSAGNWPADGKVQKGIRTPKNMNYHGISSKLSVPLSTRGKNLVLQYTVKHEEHKTSFCGGGYIKLLGSDVDQANFGGSTPYHIMFGPDLCGYDVSRIHLIFTHKGKNLLRKDDIKLDYDEKNEFTHLYTLVVKPDNTYEVYFDMKKKSEGSLHDHWDFPNKTFDDPADKKPSDWVDEKMIDDPNAKKPANWVEDARIRDPDAKKPPEWDEEEDGAYEAPLIANPKYKGMWVPERISNPEYKGEWKPKQLPNPEYMEEVYPYDDIGSVGFELWTVNMGSIFDNILVTDSLEHANKVAEEVWKPFAAKEKDAKKEWEKSTGKTSSTDAAAKSDTDDDDDDDDEVINMDASSKDDL